MWIESKTVMSWSSGKKKGCIFCNGHFFRRIFFISMHSVLNKLSEYVYTFTECAKFHGSCSIVPSWVFRGSKIFLHGSFVSPKFFQVSISWVQNFFLAGISGVKDFLTSVISQFHLLVTWEKVAKKYISNYVFNSKSISTVVNFAYNKGTSSTKLLMLLRNFSLH